MTLTLFTLGFHILLERLWEWDTLMPKDTPLSQISHFANLPHLLPRAFGIAANRNIPRFDGKINPTRN